MPGAIAALVRAYFAAMGAGETPPPENPEKKKARQKRYREKRAPDLAKKARARRWRETYL